MVKNLPTLWETWVRSLGWEDPLEKGTATHSSILAWRIPGTEEPGRLQSMGSWGVGHNWATFTQGLVMQPVTDAERPHLSIWHSGFPSWRTQMRLLHWSQFLTYILLALGMATYLHFIYIYIFFFNNFIRLFIWAALGLRCCGWAFLQLRCAGGALSCGAWTSRWRDFSWTARALLLSASLVMTCGLSSCDFWGLEHQLHSYGTQA